jgi:hypothetical protein
MRRLLVLVAVLAALAVLAAAAALSTPSAPGGSQASRPAVVCPRLNSVFSLEFGAWGGASTGIAKRELFAAAVTRGAARAGGVMIYGSATPTQAATDSACRRTRPAPRPISSRLSAPYTYRLEGHSGFFTAPNGDRLLLELVNRTTVDPLITHGALAVTFRCAVPGAVTVLMTNSGGGTYFTVRIRRELYATAVLRPNDKFTFRVSRRCERR